jgi:hypothetical protein
LAAVWNGLGRKRVLRVVIEEHFAGEICNHGAVGRFEVGALDVLRSDLQPVEHEFGADRVDGSVSDSLNDPGDSDLNGFRVFEDRKFEAGHTGGGSWFQRVAMEITVEVVTHGGRPAANTVVFTNSHCLQGVKHLWRGTPPGVPLCKLLNLKVEAKVDVAKS